MERKIIKVFTSTAKNSSLLPAEKCGARLGRKIIQIIIKFSSSSSITENLMNKNASLLLAFSLSCLFSLKTTEILFFLLLFLCTTKSISPTPPQYLHSPRFDGDIKNLECLRQRIIKTQKNLIIRQPRVFPVVRIWKFFYRLINAIFVAVVILKSKLKKFSVVLCLIK